MSNAKKCDRCGAFYEEKHQMFFVIENNGITIKMKDLCDKCEKELIDWVEKNDRDEQSGDTQDKD